MPGRPVGSLRRGGGGDGFTITDRILAQASPERFYDMTTKQLTAWWEEWRSFTDVGWLAVVFDVAPRTVHRWLAAGLADHQMVSDGLPTAVKEQDWAAGLDTWRIHPLGCFDWLVGRKAAMGRTAPKMVERMADPKVWACTWDFAKHGGCEDFQGPCPPFSWEAANDMRVSANGALVVWYEQTGDLGGPFWVHDGNTPEAWVAAIRARDGE